ncbi:CD209 antigen-like protein C isoform X2 [Engystomops pustulosus]|uniref:CD209 antigen-like protein C isoform X2 n=1 Tax=Engystomops pustulosus TaxID=76066 RepID=UPI003AFAD5DA
MKNKKTKNVDDQTRRKDNYIGNDVYVNMDELNKEEQMIRTMKKGREPTVTKKESTSKIPKVRIIVAALILLVVLFLILIAVTSVLFIYYLEMRKEVSHQKNLADNQERMNLENAESLENIKQNFQNDIKVINKTFETICGKCPSGWQRIGVFCYYISTDTSSWDAAKDECIKKGATLLPLKTQEETAALHDFIKTDRYWIGMRRDKEPEKWKWLDGEMMSYSKWMPDEPNNPTTEECAESYYGEWNDVTCSRTLKYACKRGCC